MRLFPGRKWSVMATIEADVKSAQKNLSEAAYHLDARLWRIKFEGEKSELPLDSLDEAAKRIEYARIELAAAIAALHDCGIR